jgi:hypothetical protein
MEPLEAQMVVEEEVVLVDLMVLQIPQLQVVQEETMEAVEEVE